jgi:hypothetical protein
MRLRQHERLAIRLREAKARGDVLGVARLQQALAKRTEAAVEAAAAGRPERVNLRAMGAPTAREAHRITRAAVVAAGTLDAVAVFERVTPGVWADRASDA